MNQPGPRAALSSWDTSELRFSIARCGQFFVQSSVQYQDSNEEHFLTSSPNLRGGSYWLCCVTRYFEFYFGLLISPCRLFLSCLPLDLDQPLVSHGVVPPHPCSDLGPDIDWETPFLL